MAADTFQIEFVYDKTVYIGIVTPIRSGGDTSYSIQVESENQESNLTLIAKPSLSALEDWDFECEDETDPLDYYDKGLLDEIGEAIEKHLGETDKGEALGLDED
jgi:hypothetical protein